MRVPHEPATGRRGRGGVVPVEPLSDIEEINLLGPDHAGDRLALDRLLILGDVRLVDRGVKLVGLVLATRDVLVEALERLFDGSVGEAEAKHLRAAGGDLHAGVMQTGLGAKLGGVRRRFAVDDLAVEGVFDKRSLPFRPGAVQTQGVGFVVGEQRCSTGLAVEESFAHMVRAEQIRRRFGHPVVRPQAGIAALARLDPGLGVEFPVPGPGVAEPQVRQHMDLGLFRTAVEHLDTDAHVLRREPGKFNHDVVVAILMENAGVQQFPLGHQFAPAPVAVDQFLVRVFGVRILVLVFGVAEGRGGIDIEVIFLHVLAMVPLAPAQAEEALLEDRILAVPKGERQVQDLIAVGNAGQAVLAPAVSLGAGHVVGEKVPSLAIGGVILADGPPGSLGKVRAPATPLLAAQFVVSKAAVFRGVKRHGGSVVGRPGVRGF